MSRSTISLVVAGDLLEGATEIVRRIDGVAREPVLVRTRDTLRRVEQAFATRILAGPAQQGANGLFRLGGGHVRDVLRIHGALQETARQFSCRRRCAAGNPARRPWPQLCNRSRIAHPVRATLRAPRGASTLPRVGHAAPLAPGETNASITIDHRTPPGGCPDCDRCRGRRRLRDGNGARCDRPSGHVRDPGAGPLRFRRDRLGIRQPPASMQSRPRAAAICGFAIRRNPAQPDRRSRLRQFRTAGRQCDRRARSGRPFRRHQGRLQHGRRRTDRAVPGHHESTGSCTKSPASAAARPCAITRVPNQPADTNNVEPTYASDGSIIFVSDRSAHRRAPPVSAARRIRIDADDERRSGNSIPRPAA